MQQPSPFKNLTSTLNPSQEFPFQILIHIQLPPSHSFKRPQNTSPPIAIYCAFPRFTPVPDKTMAPNKGYLTFSPATSSTRSILLEPSERIPETSEQRQEPSERIPEPSEQSHEPSERSQEPPEWGLAQEDSKWLKEKIEQIAELKKIDTKWPGIGAAVGLPQNTCFQILHNYQRLQDRSKVAIPDTIPEPSYRRRSWESSEDEMLFRLFKAGVDWDDMPTKLKGRSGAACKARFYKLRGKAENT